MTTILHNPRCSTSRTVLGMLAERGIEPTVIDYMKNPLSRSDLVGILVALELSPKDLLRRKEDAWKALGKDADALSDNEMIDILLSEPRLIERPVVITAKGARIGRPPETVLEIL